jgi:hypothetical protein
MFKSPQENQENNDEAGLLPLASRPATARAIDDIVFKNMIFNSTVALLAGGAVYGIIRIQTEFNYWSCLLLAASVLLVAGEDFFNWLFWQLTVEKALKQEPLPGFWMRLLCVRGKLKADLGSNNYADKPIWRCDIYFIQDNCVKAACTALPTQLQDPLPALEKGMSAAVEKSTSAVAEKSRSTGVEQDTSSVVEKSSSAGVGQDTSSVVEPEPTGVDGFPEDTSLRSAGANGMPEAASQTATGASGPPEDPQKLKVSVYMRTDSPFPVAMQTDETLFVIKPPPRISMLVIEFIEDYLERNFGKKRF